MNHNLARFSLFLYSRILFSLISKRVVNFLCHHITTLCRRTARPPAFHFTRPISVYLVHGDKDTIYIHFGANLLFFYLYSLVDGSIEASLDPWWDFLRLFKIMDRVQFEFYIIIVDGRLPKDLPMCTQP